VHNAPELVSVSGACENVDTLYKVDHFGKPAYLAQSDQLYLELLTPELKKVYAEIQSFRREEEVDGRHLCQFALFEIEHLGNLNTLMGNLEGILKAAVKEVVTTRKDELALLGMPLKHFVALENLTKDPYRLERVTYTAAVDFLKDEFPSLNWGDDLKADHEASLVKEYGPCFITHYPTPIKFFNMLENKECMKDANYPDFSVVNSCDLLLPFSGESAGAAEREHEHDRIVDRLKSSAMYERLMELGGKDEDFDWYLDAHKDKDIPLHSGAGIGMARVAQFILGVDDIREAVPFVINRDTLL
jgi:asparaginyl-tRNA synthetase